MKIERTTMKPFGSGDRQILTGLDVLITEPDGEMFLLVTGIPHECTEEGFTLYHGPPVKAALPVLGEHLQFIVDLIRQQAAENGITII